MTRQMPPPDNPRADSERRRALPAASTRSPVVYSFGEQPPDSGNGFPSSEVLSICQSHTPGSVTNPLRIGQDANRARPAKLLAPGKRRLLRTMRNSDEAYIWMYRAKLDHLPHGRFRKWTANMTKECNDARP